MLLVPYSKDHNYFPLAWYCFGRALFAGTERDYTTIWDNLATAVAVYLNQA